MDQPGPSGCRQHPSRRQPQSGFTDWQQVQTFKLVSGQEDPSEYSILDNICPVDGNSDMNNICSVDCNSNMNNICPVDGNSILNNICPEDGNTIMNNICAVDGNKIMNNIFPVNENVGNTCLEDGFSDICQLDGDASVESDSRNGSVSLEDYDSEEEANNLPVRAVLVPAPRLVGQPFTLTVDQSEQVAAPVSLPLTMVANFCSCYNKVKNLKQSHYTFGLDLTVNFRG